MTIRHLRIFKVVCSCMSITGAALEMNMTQSAVSIAVKELESFYQTRLFDRIHRKIYLTESGKMLLQYADSLLRQFDELSEMIRDEGNYTHCSFGVNLSFGETMLPGLMRKIREQLPTAKLKVYVDNSHEIEEKRKNNEIDFSIVDAYTGESNQKAVFLCEGRMAAVCAGSDSSAEQMSIRELATKNLLLREVGSGNRNCIDAAFQTHGCAVRPMVESSSDLSLLAMARQGLGVAILPVEVVEDDLRRGSLREIKLLEAGLQRYYYLVYSEKKHLTRTVRNVIQLLFENFSGSKGE